MNLESVIENDEQKIIFLKAIILGINYGKTDNADVYRHNILNEIKKVNEKINVNKKILNNSLEKNKQPSLLESNKFQDDLSPGKDTKITESIYDSNILNLENQKSYTINLINNLTASNYQYNYSKINLLKTNLINIDKEIQKNKINILKDKEKNNIKSTLPLTHEKFLKMMNKRENLKTEHIENKITKSIEEKENNVELLSEEYNLKSNENKNLSGELEKTLSSLTSLLS